MHPDGSAPDAHSKDYMQQFFHDGGRDADIFQGNVSGGGAPPQFQPPLGGMQVSMDVLESFMAIQDAGSGQPTSPQVLMEQQLRLSQLQQLQQLQNQIFQQQVRVLLPAVGSVMRCEKDAVTDWLRLGCRGNYGILTHLPLRLNF